MLSLNLSVFCLLCVYEFENLFTTLNIFHVVKISICFYLFTVSIFVTLFDK